MERKELRIKIKEILKLLNVDLIGKEKIMKITLLGILSQENIILVGPPGTAKSEISRRITQIFKKGVYFEYLLTKFTTPEEIFGPLSIKKLQEDKFERNTEGYLPNSEIVFLDEIFKANSSILNTLLTVVNEKVFHNGLKRQKIPLISLVGASNEIPIDNDELMALYDRFLLREVVDYVDDENVEELLEIKENRFEIPEELKLTVKDLETIKYESKKVKIPNIIKKVISQIRIEYNRIFSEDKFEILSDRKLVKMVNLLKISAYINERDEIDFSDILILSNCLWNNPENIEKITNMILNIIKRNIIKDSI